MEAMDGLENGRAFRKDLINEFKLFITLKSIEYCLSDYWLCRSIRDGILRWGNGRGIYLWTLQEPRAMGTPIFKRTFKAYLVYILYTSSQPLSELRGGWILDLFNALFVHDIIGYSATARTLKINAHRLRGMCIYTMWGE